MFRVQVGPLIGLFISCPSLDLKLKRIRNRKERNLSSKSNKKQHKKKVFKKIKEKYILLTQEKGVFYVKKKCLKSRMRFHDL